jgi:hypothetical protein
MLIGHDALPVVFKLFARAHRRAQMRGKTITLADFESGAATRRKFRVAAIRLLPT